ncbi:MAG TPA: efflux RND transporter periplasmic adaptor subunit, partial [Gammaproteobacteria bacterium]|nr:efflux RND transporter periplasmic adaptor subunit [Gammaproteobacteria bacterium]
MAAAGIEVGEVRRAPVAGLINAPGEVMLNAYRTSKVTPRIAAQVSHRHARLGERVQAGQVLVTLSSVAMAEAQGDLLVADREWRRVKKLGRDVVSERRYVAAQVARQQAYARVRAYGMSEAQIQALLRQGDVSQATGDFKLAAPQAGTVIQDDFIVGEFVEPGRVLFEIP